MFYSTKSLKKITVSCIRFYPGLKLSVPSFTNDLAIALAFYDVFDANNFDGDFNICVGYF